jgi:D-alanine--poly(phosphoribitol) ligase subunit 2
VQQVVRRHVPGPMTISTEVLAVLADVLDTREVYDAPDLPLYELDLLDSLRTVELMLALSERLGIEISPAEFDRELWGSPRRIVEDMERRIESTRPGSPP